jgi:murein DD-endopeptidase MepM/ murein hydrolase activator NlpD
MVYFEVNLCCVAVSNHMPRSNVPSRSRAVSHIWPRVAVLALVGVAAASCSDSGRFDSNPYAANNRQAPPSQDVTGSIASRPVASSRVEAQPLPAPSRPASVAANGGVASGAQGLGAYRPATRNNSDVTGSVPERHAVVTPPPKPAGAWTWDGGAPVTVGYGESVEVIARKYGVPASAILQTNGIANPASIRPGQRLVIPRYVSTAAPQASVAPAPTRATAEENVHVVQPGESLTGIARHRGIAVAVLARANNIQPYAKVNAGDRLTLPGTRPVAARPTPAPAPQVAQPRTVPVEKVASAPVQNARIATPEPEKTESVVKTAEAAGGMPSFRWPVKGRVIAGFGPNTNGAQNDGINLAVPEGTPIKAADDGVVAYAGNELKGYGNLVLIRHSNGFVSAYAHASELLVKRGDNIKRGQVIAHAGQTGNVTSPQLHFEIRKGSTPVDPTKYLGGA